MFKISRIKPQSAQGTVEFALVLPILLLLILGIFAVGHLIFSYAFVLSSSREAARYGAAVGTTLTGRIYYEDCVGIRGAATRVGGVAGVQDGNVSISYDGGPDSSAKGSCPLGRTTPLMNSGSRINLGDRIYVEVALPYRPIVPILNLPEMTLRANTARTIVKSVAVGQSPDAQILCVETETTMTTSPRPSIVGENITFTVRVTAPGAPPPTAANSVSIVDIDENLICRLGLNNGVGTCVAPVFTAALHYITARFEGTMEGGCYDPSEAFDVPHRVDMSSTVTTFVSPFTTPNPSFNGAPVEVSVRVAPAYPGGGIPAGQVVVSGGSSNCTATLDATGTGKCIFYPLSPNSGNNKINLRADYLGNNNYQASTGYYSNHAVNSPTPTFINTPTPGGPTATSSAPTNTPLPTCPRLMESINFSVQSDGFLLSIRNPDTLRNVSITSFSLNWPILPTAKLRQFRFATDSSMSCSPSNSVCMWQSNPGEDPPSVAINSTDKTKWNDAAAVLGAGQTKEARLVFSDPLPNGSYRLQVNFSNLCTLTLEADRNR